MFLFENLIWVMNQKNESLLNILQSLDAEGFGIGNGDDITIFNELGAVTV